MITTKLINGEAIAELQKLDNESIDHIIVDLPYGVTSNKWDAVIPFEDMWNEFNRVIKHGGNIVLFAIQPFASMLITSNIKNYKYELIWQKSNPSGQLLTGSRPLRKHENILIFQKNKNKGIIYNPQMSEGHEPAKPKSSKDGGPGSNYGDFNWEPQVGNDNLINGVRYPTSIIDETALAGKKIGQTYNPQMSEGHKPVNVHLSKPHTNKNNYGTTKGGGGSNSEQWYINNELGLRHPTSIIEFKNPRSKIKGAVVNHPTKKPVDLMRYLVRQYSNEGDTILDCCMGGGSTGVACVQENRNFIGIELNKEYFAGASEWINNENRGI
jgi:site-specific DNA-methyltransferase (adenine-specific)